MTDKTALESDKTKTIRKRAKAFYSRYDDDVSKNQIKRSKDSINRWISSRERVPLKEPEKIAPMTKRIADFLRKLGDE